MDMASKMAYNVKDMKLEIKEVKSDMVANAKGMKLDIKGVKSVMAANNKDIKSDVANKIKTSHDAIMTCISNFDRRISKVENLTSSVTTQMETVKVKISANAKDLEKIGTKVARHTIYQKETRRT